jgi:hypothetical protein
MNQIQLPNYGKKIHSKVVQIQREYNKDTIVANTDHTPTNTPPNHFFITLKKRMNGYYENNREPEK